MRVFLNFWVHHHPNIVEIALGQSCMIEAPLIRGERCVYGFSLARKKLS